MGEELLALAERCERATGPDRELDILIGLAIDLCADHGWPLRKSFELSGMENLLRQAESHHNIWRTELPRYSASIDAAMTLVPEGWLLQGLMERNASGKQNWRWKADLWTPSWDNGVRGVARLAHSNRAAPALALCAAALKARASLSAAASNPLGAAPSPSSTVPGTPLDREDDRRATGEQQ